MYTPINAITGKAYQGNNVLTLTLSAANLKTSDPRWLTYLQAKEKGWHVRQGAKGTTITVIKETKIENDEKSEIKRMRKFFTVFNAIQIEGIEPLK